MVRQRDGALPLSGPDSESGFQSEGRGEGQKNGGILNPQPRKTAGPIKRA